MDSKPQALRLLAAASHSLAMALLAIASLPVAAQQIGFETGFSAVDTHLNNRFLFVNRVGPTDTTQSVTFTTANDTAMAGTDFGTSAAQVTGTLTFAPGETTKTITVGPVAAAAPYIRIINVTTPENPKYFFIRLGDPTNGATLGIDSITMQIVNDENQLSMASATASFSEGSGAQQVMVERIGGFGAFDVNYTFTNGTAVNGTHYSGANGTMHWSGGEWGMKAIPVTIHDSPGVNPNRTFTVTLGTVFLNSPGGFTVSFGANRSTVVSIMEDEQSVQFTTPATVTVSEPTPGYSFTVSRTGGTAQAASVAWEALNLTALNGTDYGVAGILTPLTGTLAWAAGETGTKSFNIPIISDAIPEQTKSFLVRLVSPVGPNLALGANSQVTVSINDDDNGVAFVQAAYEVTEGTPSVVLSVRRLGPATTVLSPTWSTMNLTAESGKDFGILNNLAPRTGTMRWAAGDTADKTIVIPILNDTIGGEGDKTFAVILTPGAGAVLGIPGSAVVTIHDNDLAPQSAVQFSQPKYLVMENGLNAVLTVNRVDVGGGFGLAATVKYATVAGTALASSDYIAPAPATAVLNWGTGDNGAKTIMIPIVNNTVAEPTESFKVVLSGASAGLALGVPSEATVTIIDDDEVFPLDGAMPAGFSTPAGSTKGWHVANDPGAYEGVFSLKSDEIDDNETAGLEMSGTFVAGNVNFRVRVSSEAGFDRLTFYVDGVPQPLTWSGTAVPGWTASPNYPLTAGVHALRWVYSKDASVTVGMDAAYIDALVTPAFTP